MGASSATRAKSPTSQNDVEQQQQQQHRPPNLNVQDIENNNNHIFINPHERFYAIIDECDLLNNNTTLINGNYLTVSLSPSTTTTAAATALRFSHLATAKTSPNQSAKSPIAVVGCKKVTIEGTAEKERKKNMQNRESPKKSPKKQLQNENEKKKKKKEKPKAPRAPNAGGNVGRGRGMAEQDQLMRRPRRKLKDKEEKYESFYLLLSHALF